MVRFKKRLLRMNTNQKIIISVLFLLCRDNLLAQKNASQYILPPITTEETRHLGFIEDPNNFPEEKMDFPIDSGIYEPTWESINKNYPAEPQWWRDGKFGIFIHWGPQAAGKS